MISPSGYFHHHRFLSSQPQLPLWCLHISSYNKKYILKSLPFTNLWASLEPFPQIRTSRLEEVHQLPKVAEFGFKCWFFWLPNLHSYQWHHSDPSHVVPLLRWQPAPLLLQLSRVQTFLDFTHHQNFPILCLINSDCVRLS